MRGLDDTDREIIRLLQADARRPYSEIADAVGLSGPAVSDRIDRLREIGLIRRFTVDLDRSLLAEGTPVLLSVRARPGAGERLQEALAAADAVEYVFRTVDDRIVSTATVPGGDASRLLSRTTGMDDIEEYTVRPLAGTDWSPRLSDGELAPDCVECGNTVTTEGETDRIDGELYHFCCPSCREKFNRQYERLREES